MSIQKEYEGKTVTDATIEACKDLGINREDLNFEVINEGTTGLLGIGGRNAVIKILNQEFPNEFKLYDERYGDNDFIKDLYGSNELRYIIDTDYCEKYCEENNFNKFICQNNTIDYLFDQWDDMAIKFKKDRMKYLIY